MGWKVSELEDLVEDGKKDVSLTLSVLNLGKIRVSFNTAKSWTALRFQRIGLDVFPYKALYSTSLSSVHLNREPREFQGSIRALK